MNIALWIAAGVLAAAFLGTGFFKLSQSKAKIIAAGQGWAANFPEGLIKAIGALEVAGAVGLILPAVTGVAPVLVPLAAVGLGLTMVGAAITHARRGETQMVVGNLVLLALAAFVAWGRFGSHAF